MYVLGATSYKTNLLLIVYIVGLNTVCSVYRTEYGLHYNRYSTVQSILFDARCSTISSSCVQQSVLLIKTSEKKWSTPRLGRFTPEKETEFTVHRRLGGPQGRSGRLQKISPPTGIRSPTVQPVASRYND